MIPASRDIAKKVLITQDISEMYYHVWRRSRFSYVDTWGISREDLSGMCDLVIGPTAQGGLTAMFTPNHSGHQLVEHLKANGYQEI